MAHKKMITMVLRNETKGALRYEGIEEDAPGSSSYIIGTLYLRKAGTKHWLIDEGEGWPQRITVEITPLETL